VCAAAPAAHTKTHGNRSSTASAAAAAGVRPALCTCCVVIRLVKLAEGRRGGHKHARTTGGGVAVEEGAKEGGNCSGGDVIDC
jgi:hypothetical protein